MGLDRIARENTRAPGPSNKSNKETGAVKNYHWEIYISQ